MNLLELRNQIDHIDDQLVELIIQRIELAPLIGKEKTAKNILDQTREEEILNKVINAGKQKNIPEKVMRTIWETLMQESRRRQETLFRV